jgi:chromate reductase, NAD(P)H dehydrogenase (quinone)
VSPSSGPRRVVGVAGSLRRGSFNRALLRAARELAPESLEIEIAEIGDVPLYNADVEEAGVPEPVERLRALVRGADALLIATPEYNHGVPGVLKNTIDWLSRPPRESCLEGKPTALMGATPGAWGTVRAQGQLRQAFVFTNTPAMLNPEVLVARARDKFDEQGRLTDEVTREFVALFLERFAEWIGRFAPGRQASQG